MPEGLTVEIPQRPDPMKEYTALEVDDYIGRMSNYLKGSGQFTDDEIASFIMTERAGLDGAGFSDNEIKTFTDYRMNEFPDPSGEPTKPIKPYSTPTEFWNLPFEERQKIRELGWLNAYFTKEQMPYSSEGGTLVPAKKEPKTSVGQIIENIKDVTNQKGLSPIERADNMLHAFDPFLDPSAYMMYKLINGKMLYASDVLWSAARKTDPTLSQEKDFEKAILQVIEYNPSGMVKAISDISEFISALSTGRKIVGPISKGKPLLVKAEQAGLQWLVAGSGESIAKGIRESDNPLEIPFIAGTESLKWFLSGYAWEVIPSLAGRAGKWTSERKAVQATKKYWKKAIDIPISKIKDASDTSLIGRFRDFTGEHLIPFYKRGGTYKERWMKTRGEIKLRAAEADELVKKFNETTKNIVGWSDNPDSYKQVTDVLTGKAKIDTLPKELHGWITEAMEARRQACLELAGYWRKRGRNKLAKTIENNADKYLPRAFRVHETTDGLWSWLRKPRYGGGEFKIRRDAWTLWEGKKAIAKHSTLEEAKEHLRNKATKAVQDKIDDITKSIDDLRGIIEKTPKPAELQSRLSALLKKRKVLSDKRTKILLNLDRKLNQLKDVFLEVPSDIPPPREATIKMAGKTLTIKPPLSTEELEALGIIRDPRYLLAKAMTQGKVDVENAKLLDYISKKWSHDMPSGFTVNELKSWASDMGFKRVPNTEQYGSLAGKYVPKAMANDLRLLIEQPTSLAQRIYDAYLSVWKEAKIVWNPATHGRNITGNVIFSDFAGTSPLNPENYEFYKKGTNALLTKNQSYKNLLKYNVIGTEYYGTEIKPISMVLGKEGKNKILESILGATSTVRSSVGRLYAAEDQIFKAAAYEKYISQGMKPRQAAAMVNRWFPNYEMLSPLTKVARKSPIGAPFLAFTDQATKIAMRGLREHPIKVAKWAALPGAMTEFSNWYLGISPAEREVIDTNRNYFEPIIPHRDEQGRVITWDLKWTIPLANDIIPDAKRYGIDVPWALSGPLVDAAVQLISGRDPFTGNPISKENASLGRKIIDSAIATGETLAPVPSLVQFGPKRITKAMSGEGRESLERAIAGIVVGLNLRAPYIVRQKLHAELREDMMSGEPDRYLMMLEKIIVFNESYKSENQPDITVDGLNRSIQYHLRKEIMDILEKED